MAKFKDYLVQNKNRNENNFNEDIIFKLREEPLADYIIDAFKTLECKNVKIKSWELITNENEIDTDTVNVRHIKNKKNRKYVKRMPIDRSRYDLLKINLKLKGKNDKGDMVEEDFTINLLLFKRCNKYYYIIGGNRFYPIYQLVDASTYTTKDYLTLKTLISPITIKRSNCTLIDVNGDNFYAPKYTLCIFKSRINALLMYLATMGYENTLRYMEMPDIIRIESYKRYDYDKEYCFKSEGGLYVKVLKYFFDNDLFIRSMVYCLVDITSDCETMEELNDLNFWVCKLGSLMMSKTNKKENKDATKLYIKGKSIVFSFARLLDNTTKRILRLKSYNKSSVYAILRWMMRNFNELKSKDNMDLKNKRIRMAEYIEAYLVKRLSTRMNKFMAINKNDVTIKDVETLVNMEPDFLIKTVLSSKKPLLRYSNSVNDQDLFTALKYTIKGIGAIGENSSNAINERYRGLHSSYVGSIDLNSSSNSDPGLSGNFTPFVKLYGYHFTDKDEAQTWDDNFRIMYKNYFNNENNPIYPLKYFYHEEKESYKTIKHIDNVKYFIDNDPYIQDGTIMLDVTKSKPKKLYIGHDKEQLEEIIKKKNEKINKPKKRRKRKTKRKKGVRVINIKKIKE